MNKKRGKLIVFEGNEASGKTTQTKMLYDYMMNKKIPIHLTHECSDGPIGKVIREYYLSGKRKSDPRLLNMLFTVDRLDHITNEDDGMLKYITSGINIISDRYYMSSLATHGSLFANTSDYWNELISIYNQNIINKKLLKPDITIYIDVKPDILINRLKLRSEKEEIFDSYDSLVKIDNAYNDAIYLLRKRGDKIFIVNGEREVDEIFKDIKDIIEYEGYVGGNVNERNTKWFNFPTFQRKSCQDN